MGTESMISNLLEKLKGFGEKSKILMNSKQAKLKAVGADEKVNNLQEKIKQPYFLLGNFASFSVGWLGEVVLPGLRNGSMIGSLQEKLKGIGEESMIMMNSTLAKLKAMGADEKMNNLKQLLLQQKNFGLLSLGGLEKVFPPQHWLRVAAPFVVAGLVLLVLLGCFSRSIGCCCRIKMMKAPGMCFRIPRFIFEACPKLCFRVFRALKLLLAK